MSQQKTILLVEDEVRLRQILKKILTAFNFQVFEAGDGHEALDIIKTSEDTIDLVISDINMPKMNGSELYENLKLLNPQIKFLMTTGHLEEDEQSRLESKGVHGFIFKPYQIQDVLEMIKTTISV